MQTLKSRLILSFAAVIAVLGLLLLCLGYLGVNRYIIDRAQQEAINDLKIARSVLDGRLKELGRAFELSASRPDIWSLKKQLGLDYIEQVRSTAETQSEIAAMAFNGNGAGGIRIMEKKELLHHGRHLADLARLEIKPTLQARPTDRQTLESVLVMEYALPLLNDRGAVRRVIYGGKVINLDFALVDEIHDVVFERQQYDGKPIGTVTIFQDDVRIATNVVDTRGERAVGTRVSARVYQKVLAEGLTWFKRAFVVTDWYLTGYEPIRDINGRPIGLLYVGILEKPFLVLRRNILLVLSLLILLGVSGAIGLSFLLAGSIIKPVDRLLEATRRLSGGDLEHRLDPDSDLKELNELTESFNEMAGQIGSRDRNLKALNQNYLDLIGFVTHELKGILATTLLNAYMVRDGYLGSINFKQRRALDAVARNLDYFDATVKNFLNLSRIEKGEISLNRTDLPLKAALFDRAVEEFSRPAEEKKLKIENRIDPGLKARGDENLLVMAANNLLGNAVKYSGEGARIELSARPLTGLVEVTVYNDGRPLTAEERAKLFHKFSRLSSPETRREKGTGLGLYITKDIIEKHGGSIRVEAGANGNSFIFTLERSKEQ